MREILLKILEECDAEIREVFLQKHIAPESPYTISATTTGESSIVREPMEEWQYLHDPIATALKWQQLRNYKRMLKNKYENRHGKIGGEPEGGSVQN